MSKASFTLSESELPSEFFSYIFNVNIKLASLSTHLEGMSLLSQYTVEEEHAPCVKFRKYFQMRQLSENTFQSINMEVYEKIFFLVEFLVFQVSRENN